MRNPAPERLAPMHPGETLRQDFMQPLHLSINRVARDLLVPPGRISNIVNGHRAITADTALRLARYFGTTARFWANLQTEYDLRLAERRLDPAEAARIPRHEGTPEG